MTLPKPSGSATATLVNPHCSFEQRTVEVDSLIREFFPALPGAALLAAGGYGRRELFPHSDIDLVLVTETESELPALREPWRDFLQRLWDSGLRVSQAVHTRAECLTVPEGNVERAVSLLDHRFLAGSREIYDALAKQLPAFWTRKRNDLLQGIVRLTRERHARFQNSLFHLEPNVKDGPGGLRDYQVIRWFDQLEHTDASAALEDDVAALRAIRCELHLAYARDQNVLNFDAQDSIGGANPAALMSEFYRAAREIYRAEERIFDAWDARNSPLFARVRESRSRISNEEFSVVRGLAYFRNPQREQSDPESVMRLFEFVAHHGVKLADDTARRIHANYQELGRPVRWPHLARILNQPHAALALREMHETGLLGAIFPEFAEIECFVIRDFYHQYTVDEHTLVAIANVLALANQPSTPFSQLARETPQRAELLLALLFHDTGKNGEESHSKVSARLADAALTRIGAPADLRETVVFLIEAHLEMSAVMQSRDLSDPATARTMAHRIETTERLKLLTLLTWADISAVNPHAMTPWRASLLWQLYTVTDRELTRELESDRVEGLPVRYLRTHSDAERAEHAHMEASGTEARLERSSAAWRLTLVSRDRPYLFASAAGAISSFGMDIVRAEAFTNSRGFAIDIFTFTDPLRTLELNPSEVENVRRTVESAVRGKLDVAKILERRPPPKIRAPIAPRISIENPEGGHATLVEITAADRPGLLYDLARAISAEACSIEIVLINTEAQKAIDVFYVTEAGAPVSEPTRAHLSESLLKACGH